MARNDVDSLWLRTLSSPFVLIPGKLEPVDEDSIWRSAKDVKKPAIPVNPLARSIYISTGDWSWFNNLAIEQYRELVPISTSVSFQYSTSLRIGKAGTREFIYMNKSWARRETTMSHFVTELGILKYQLRTLQGSCVPTVIGVRVGPSDINILMEIPHQTFFIEASPDMPNILKERVVDAVSRIHRQGVLLGNINLRNFLICPDGRVVVTNFEYCKSSSPNKALKIDLASPADLRMEMRKLKVRLDYGTAREDEHKRFEAQHRRYHANFLHMQESAFRGERGVNLETETMEDTTDPPIHLETSDWFPRAQERPRRFITPGVTAETFRKARQAFLLLAPEDPIPLTVPKPEELEEGSDALDLPPQPIPRRYKHHDKTATQCMAESQVTPADILFNNTTPHLPRIVVRDFGRRKTRSSVVLGKRKRESGVKEQQSPKRVKTPTGWLSWFWFNPFSLAYRFFNPFFSTTPRAAPPPPSRYDMTTDVTIPTTLLPMNQTARQLIKPLCDRLR